MSHKLAECLLRRKELQQKLDLVSTIKAADLYETKVKRVRVTESIDDLTLTVPKLTASQVTAEHDFYARQLRYVDAAIQQANWTLDIDNVDNCFQDFEAK